MMRQAAVKYGGVRQQPMTDTQAVKLKKLSEEVYQPRQFEENLTRAEADRRIAALEAEIELANSF